VADPRHTLGTEGEAAVAAWYDARGYEVLDRNWRCSAGELDLVVARGRTIVFCEVKTRRSDAFGTPAEAVTPRKQQRLRRLALLWLGACGVHGDLRFDVASVRPARHGLEVEVLEAAF
jgi:putative endonuclease